jgi:hypothetical protein
MALIDRIVEANRHDYSDFIPWFVAGVRVGCVRRSFAHTLARWPEVFLVRENVIRMSPSLDDPLTPCNVRTDAVAEVCRQLRIEGVVQGWRDEHYRVGANFHTPPLLLMERAAVPWFGVTAYGVHMNGFVRDSHGLDYMWIARRALNKPTSAGKLDQIVAGGQPFGIGLRDNIIKECAEEASIPFELAQHVRPAGAVTYVAETDEGIRPDVIFNFDLLLPEDFSPVNADGEVDAFYLWDIGKIHDIISESRQFKANCALVVIDSLIRHGYLAADHPEYQALTSGLLPDILAVPEHWASQ